MSLKKWVIDRVPRPRRVKALLSRADLPPRDTGFEPSYGPADDPGYDSRLNIQPDKRSSASRRAEPSLAAAEHLGAYGTLISTIRDELEHFIVSQLQLHLAIADRDRFVLTSIAVHCGSSASQDRLGHFMQEFKPEQVKRYLVREVIAGLPNAAAIDLSQFAGLVDADAAAEQATEEDSDDYSDLLAQLDGPPPPGDGPAYEVRLVGRWSELDAASPMAAAAAPRAATGPVPVTPLAGQRIEFELEDADGRRSVVLPSVVPGRRYIVGKDEGCDIVVRGTYTSRRHAELWLERGSWRVGDAGSTNGLRIEPAGGDDDASAPLRLIEGARLVLSARSDGPAADCPWLALRAAPGRATQAAARVTPIAPMAPMAPMAPVASPTPAPSPRTPLTAVRGTPPTPLVISTSQSGTPQVLALTLQQLPLGIGRSRRQALVIHRRFDAVSGHHLDILDIDAEGADVQVHGDNGVLLEGRHHAAGTRLRWPVGQTLLLGAAADEPDACTLLLRPAAPA
ncbi:FHA domain-containing protein [Aquabacterium sp.]|uniref:FHA domain-containing protein n=1 Tax=Aquabacterium sp. TaxID=1872578 RepID=UPI002CBE58B3|nr:FHA domain-containing protein [Aquabacterium sp.]HSW08582.1 FHA domain-containing protein [Aquabacterium sp.]